MEHQVAAAADQQVSLTDPDARSMATSGKGTGIVGYDVQTAVDVENHLIVAHEVTNLCHPKRRLFLDRSRHACSPASRSFTQSTRQTAIFTEKASRIAEPW